MVLALDNAVLVSAAANRIGVSQSRVRQWISENQVEAQKIGAQWFINYSDIARLGELRQGAGVRPLAPGVVWGLAAALDRATVSREVQSSVSRALSKMRQGLIRPEHMRVWGKNRYIQTSQWCINSGRRETITARSDIMLTGIDSSLPELADMVFHGDTEIIANADTSEVIINSLKLVPHFGLNAKLILHIANRKFETKTAPSLISALDLSDADDPRTKQRGLETLGRILRDAKR